MPPAVGVDRRGGVGHVRDELVDVPLAPDELAGVGQRERGRAGREGPTRRPGLVRADLQETP